MAVSEGHDPVALANFFVRLANRDGGGIYLTQLVKLTYISHGWHLALYDAPLSARPVQAWHYGPVIPEVYFAFKNQGSKVKKESPFSSKSTEFSEAEIRLLEKVYREYSGFSPYALSRMTHKTGGPWSKAYAAGKMNQVIPDSVIKEHYLELRAKGSNS